MKILDVVPVQMRGRGHPGCVPLECECGCTMLWEFSRGPQIKCPQCKCEQDFTDDPSWKAHNGQHK